MAMLPHTCLVVRDNSLLGDGTGEFAGGSEQNHAYSYTQKPSTNARNM
jgi:hypothetical protein